MLIARRTIVATVGIGFSVVLLVPGFSPVLAQSPGTGPGDAAAAALTRLKIDLPRRVADSEPVRRPLEELGRETCDQDAITHLAGALEAAGYRREAAVAQVSFSAQCGGHAPALRGAINTLLKLSDYTTAESVASDLIKLEPFNDNGYFLRALARDGNRSFKAAIDDYVTAIELFGNKDRISSVSYLKIARDYEQLGQFCDAMLPIQQWVALDPSRHDTSQTQAILSGYAAKGGCAAAAATSGSTETFPAPRVGAVVKVPVTVNNVAGTFILDTGASYVALRDSFAKKAKIEIEDGSTVRIHTANGIADGHRGRADTMQLRSLKAKSVIVIVEADSAAAYDADGLLGMSFLSRFNMAIDNRSVRISPNKPR